MHCPKIAPPATVRIASRLTAIAMLCGSALVVGCFDDSPAIVPVAGVVTLDGKNLGNAYVTFSPLGPGGGPASVATTDSDGAFQLVTIGDQQEGAVVGMHRVTIVTARAATPVEGAKISKELVPLKYRDGSYRLEVPAEGLQDTSIELLKK